MLTYATVADLMSIKKVEAASATAAETAQIAEYLRRATAYIDRICRRRFFPFEMLRMYPVPTFYQDLRNRSFVFGDLQLDDDLLETWKVMSGGTLALVDSNATLAAAADANTTTLTLSDVAGVDEDGETRFSAGDLLQIDHERMQVISVNEGADTLYVRRAQLNTIAAAHDDATAVYKLGVSELVPGIQFNMLDYNYFPKFGLRLTYPNRWTSSVVWRSRVPQVFVTGWWGYADQYPTHAWINSLATLSSDIDATATTIPVSDADGTDELGATAFRVGDLIRIGREFMEVTAISTSPNQLTVLRAQNGTMPYAATSGARLYRWKVTEDIVEACLTIAKTWRDADQSVGGRQGVSEMSQGVEISIPKDAAQTLKLYVRPIIPA